MTAASPSLGARGRAAVAATWLATLVGAIELVSARQLGGGDLFEGSFALVFLGFGVDVLAFSSVGAILTIRRPENRVGVILMVTAALVVLTFLGFVVGAALTATRGTDDVPAGLLALLGALGIFPTFMAVPTLALVIPDGHLPGPRWRWPVRAIATSVAVSSVSIVIRPGAIAESLANNPFRVAGVAWLETLSGLLYAIVVPSSLLLALAGVAVRFRRSRGVEREQLKWFVAAIVTVVVFLSLAIADGATDPTVFDLLGAWSLSLPPIAIGIAVLRYRLYDIDRIISRTISYGLVTASLLSVYGVAVLLLQTPLGAFTGGETVAVAASTLVAAALFQPLRQRIQAAVDRRFNRAHYDAERTMASFAAVLRDEVDPTHVRAALLSTVGSAIGPNNVSVWFRGERR